MNFPPIERWIRKSANAMGLDIKRHRPIVSAIDRLATMLRVNGVDIVFDIGANTGQFARSLRDAGYPGRIVSFEPLSAAHSALLRASDNDPDWQIAPRVAIGSSEGEVQFNIAANSVSSSILGMLESHIRAAPQSVFVGTERVPLSTLDKAAIGHLDSQSKPFIKIDTQGYESNVLDGAKDILARAAGIHIELSFLPLYEGQELFGTLLSKLQAEGFSIWGIWPGFVDEGTGRMLQVDAVLFRD